MLKKGPHPIDRAIWGAFDGAGTQPPAGPPSAATPRPEEQVEEDSGVIDLGALIAEAKAEMAGKRGEAGFAPAKAAHPLPVFPFGPPPIAPEPAPPEDVTPRFRRASARSLIVPGALIVIAGALTVMAVRSDNKPMPVACAISVDLPTTPAPPPSQSAAVAVEAIPTARNTPTAPPTAAPSSRPPVRRSPAPPTTTAAPAPPALQGTTPAPPAPLRVDPCKGDLLCAMKRATQGR